ncbi:MAG: hypothetical protein II371_07080, partial [Flavobacteriales bacterium]|nr:hypothetical protein [Flavobacteriales bacterium]
PNREVKPDCADGTALVGGRVSSCLFRTTPCGIPRGVFVFEVIRIPTRYDRRREFSSISFFRNRIASSPYSVMLSWKTNNEEIFSRIAGVISS